MKKLVVKDSCIGCGACVAIDSEHFDFNEMGLSTPISNDNLETDELKNAISSCPVNAIKIEETEAESDTAKEAEVKDSEEDCEDECCGNCDGECCHKHE